MLRAKTLVAICAVSCITVAAGMHVRSGRKLKISAKRAPCGVACGQDVRARVNLSEIGPSNVAEQVVVVDRVFDEKRGAHLSLLHPYVVIAKQRPVRQVYDMRHAADVNAEATEEVLDAGETPCGPETTACGDSFSRGFCCSCEDENYTDLRAGRDCTRAKSGTGRSVHCLRFSDLWYSVRELSDPRLEHSVKLRVYQRRYDERGPYWRDLTGERTRHVGTQRRSDSSDGLRVLYGDGDSGEETTHKRTTRDLFSV